MFGGASTFCDEIAALCDDRDYSCKAAMGQRLLHWVIQNECHSPENAPQRSIAVRAICAAADDQLGLLCLYHVTFADTYLKGRMTRRRLTRHLNELTVTPYGGGIGDRQNQILIPLHRGRVRFAKTPIEGDGREWLRHYIIVAPGITPDWMAYFVQVVEVPGHSDYPWSSRSFEAVNLPKGFFTVSWEELPNLMRKRVRRIR